MVKSIFFIAALMMTSASVVHATTGNQATSISVNPGEDPNEARNSSDVEGSTIAPGLQATCPACYAKQVALQRLSEQSNKRVSYDALLPNGYKSKTGEPTTRDGSQ